MKIQGIEGLTPQQLNDELQRGGRFVIFEYCFSIIVVTFRRNSCVYFIKEGESTFAKGLVFSLISLLAGWWGLPWGPVYTIDSIIRNCSGGKNVTSEIVSTGGYHLQNTQQAG